jgi:hypothetical protein
MCFLHQPSILLPPEIIIIIPERWVGQKLGELMVVGRQCFRQCQGKTFLHGKMRPTGFTIRPTSRSAFAVQEDYESIRFWRFWWNKEQVCPGNATTMMEYCFTRMFY